MTPRLPTATLVIDSNIVLGALRGYKTGKYIERAGRIRRLTTTAEARREVERVLARIDPGGTAAEAAAALFDALEIIADDEYASALEAAASRLARAPASANGSPRDAHILALAWTLDADIWSHDRDYAGTGWPSWSSANLVAALADD